MLTTEDRKTIEESYESATHATSLKVESETRGSADMLIAAGWSDARLGMALMRLHSEYEGSAKPKMPDARAIERIAGLMVTNVITKKEAYSLAREQAQKWYANELSLFRLKLKTVPEVSHQLYLRAERRGTPVEAVGPSLAWWLDQKCVPCGGLGKTTIPGTPALSAHNCPACRGSGKKHQPHGENGRWLTNLMDSSVNSARKSLKGRFVHQQKGQT